jgi:Flp pilus assembly pilin Flp
MTRHVPPHGRDLPTGRFCVLDARGIEVSDILLRPYIRVQSTIAGLRNREEGQTITEYALIIASIAILLIIAMLFLAGKIDDLFSSTGTSVASPGPLP